MSHANLAKGPAPGSDRAGACALGHLNDGTRYLDGDSSSGGLGVVLGTPVKRRRRSERSGGVLRRCFEFWHLSAASSDPRRRGAWFAAMMTTAIKKLGKSLNAFSAQDSDALRNRLDLCRAVNSRTNADEAMLQGLKQLLVEAPRVTFSIASERPHRHSQKRVPNIVAQRSSALQNPEAKDP